MRSKLIENSSGVFTVAGKSFATSGNLGLLHRRVRHLPMHKLVQIYKLNLVDGFKLKGRQSASSCSCDTCRQAGIRRRPQHSSREHPNTATFVGHSVSTDVKDLPYKSIHGYRYAVNFVDHYSKLGFVYFMRTKDEVHEKLRLYLADMRRLGVRVVNIYSDRGS